MVMKSAIVDSVVRGRSRAGAACGKEGWGEEKKHMCRGQVDGGCCLKDCDVMGD